MKQRNVMTVVLLSIITLGIYDLYWLVQTKKVLNRETDIHTPTIWLLFAPVVAFFGVMIFALMLAASSNGAASKSGVILALVEIAGFLAIVPITFYWFFKFSKAVNHYTKGEINTAMAFILLWILRFIGIAVIQDKFNDMQSGVADTATSPTSPTAFAAAVPSQQPQLPVASPQFGAPSTPSGPVQDSLAQPSDPIASVAPNQDQPTQPATAPVTPVAPESPVVASTVPASEVTNGSTDGVSAEKASEDNGPTPPSVPPSAAVVG